MKQASEEDRHRAITRRLSTTLPRILRELSRDLDRKVTQKLRDRGHTAISLSHQIVFSNLGLGSTRVTVLADRAQITQQAMGKTLRELESLGYLQRTVDATDRRARAISMTDKGLKLVEDAVEVVEEIRVEYAAKIGEEALENLEHCLREAAAKLDLDYLPQLWAEAKDS